MKCNFKFIAFFLILSSIVFTNCTSDKDKFRKQIQSELDVINQKAPIKLSDSIRLDSCKLHNNQIDYYYTVTDSSLSNDNVYLQSLENEIKDLIKEDMEMNKILDNNISIQYNYRNDDKEIVYSFKL